MRVLFATSELFPFVKTGGLGDVAAGLPPALKKAGVDIRYFLPGYPEIKKNLAKKKLLHSFPELFGHQDVLLISGTLPDGLQVYVLDAPSLFERSHPYLGYDGGDWPDNHIRFGAFCYVAAHLAQYDKSWQPDIIHGNDWQCGLIPAYQRFDQIVPKSANVITIHNLGYQGLFPAHAVGELGLPWEEFAVDGFEYYHQLGFLKAGLYYADHLTTVSPTYAKEICSEGLGYGLQGLLQARQDHTTGILNGIDDVIWNPTKDAAIKYPYSASATANKAKNKQALLKEAGLQGQDKKMLFAFIGRLTPQKGVDILLKAIPDLLDKGASLYVLGTGDKNLEQQCEELVSRYPDRVVFHKGYDEELAHRIQAGADAMIVPSYFEPCGLVQMFALRYGTLPIVRRTGGLADSVTTETGFIFDEPTTEALRQVLNEALDLYQNAPRQWQKMRKTAMLQNFNWTAAAQQYAALYQTLTG